MNSYDYILQKYQITPSRQYSIEIPNMGRNELAKLFAELGFSTGVEIGVDQGEYTEMLCLSNPNLTLTGIDPYRADSYDPGLASISDSQQYLDEIYAKAQERVKNLPVTLLRKTSMEAVTEFEDNSLDFVYIDGHHDFVHVTNDIHHWLPKIKVGGILSGHDYAKFPTGKQNHVKSVVDAYFTSYRMIPYFIVGLFEMKPGLIRDRYRSWFYIKK